MLHYLQKVNHKFCSRIISDGDVGCGKRGRKKESDRGLHKPSVSYGNDLLVQKQL